ncbi:uncharacterized protein TRUGW13939_10904 [Talaromyces rugulosus]|uniref:AB hydrolase-1 domain-containing protein n=1 Tax=Talaromyces rugulosus TaxID=121627 RepID=A0A7H8RGM6_TALRU|nr:uncharacterized protein TRUGW13939_10904 [Talaromyces rugulosus]QKX63733.1 hypothetical protein TRUGW13939_10904 [Talaromyces rugulosus]
MTDGIPKLYPGEQLDNAAGFPVLFNYFPADPKKALVVFIPGGGHNARISYGGHQGSDEKNFLAHWMNQHGHGFLAVSYPLESSPPIMPATAPQFRIRDWGKQAAEVTHRVVKQYGLSGRVVLIGWSMGGRIVVPYSVAVRSLGLHVDLYVGLAATPGLHGMRPPPPGIKSSESGYGAFTNMSNLFLAQIHEQQAMLNGGRTIVPDDVYVREYFGYTPVSLAGWNLRYDPAGHGQAFVEEFWTSTKDAATDQAEHLPMIASLTGNSILDTRHVIMDQATWTFMLTQRFTRIIETRNPKSGLTQARFEKLADMVHSPPRQLSRTIPGNHYFFLGERGARQTSDAIVELLATAIEFESQFQEILSG